MTSYAFDAIRDRVPGADPRNQPGPVMLTRPDGSQVTTGAVVEVWNARRTAAKQDRLRYEGMWKLCQAFVSGRQWVGLTRDRDSRVVEERNPRKRERHTANVLTQYFETAKGKLYSDDFMPNLQIARPDAEAQHLTEQFRHAFQYAWDEEINASERIGDLLIEMLGYGTAAMECCIDNTAGPYIGEVPVNHDGAMIPIDEGNQDYQAMQEGRLSPTWRIMHEGRIGWNVLSPFHFLVPPGLPYPDKFPWIIVDTPMLLDDARAEFGEPAMALVEQDLSQVNLIGDKDLTNEDPMGGSAKLKDHCLVSVGHERPSRMFPHGRTVYWSQEQLLRERPKMRYTINGEPKAGIAFFRYHRVPRRFYGIGIVEPGIGPQRQRNRARSQHIEMKDKNLGRVYAHRGSLSESNLPVGKIMELIEVKQSATFPTETQGVPPGPWISDEVAMNDADLEKAMGFRDLVNSESLKGVTAYAAFALQAEQEDKRVGPILADLRAGILNMSRFTNAAIRMYWSTEKEILIAGPDQQVQSFTFNGSTMPEGVAFTYGKGAAAPRSQAAEMQKIFDIYDRSVASGRPLGIEWLMKSLDAGKALPVPESEQQLQQEKAQLENMLAAQGHPPTVSPIDDHQIHIQEHKLAMEQAMIAGRQDVAAILQQHIAEHQAQMQAQAQLVTSVPGQQGAFGAQGGPDAMAANAGQGQGVAQAQGLVPPSG